jgi:hypothetical protein
MAVMDTNTCHLNKYIPKVHITVMSKILRLIPTREVVAKATTRSDFPRSTRIRTRIRTDHEIHESFSVIKSCLIIDIHQNAIVTLNQT